MTPPISHFPRMGFEIVQAPNGESLYLDITLPSHLARVTLGRLGNSQGYCDTEILDTDSAEAIHWQHQEFSRAEELEAALADFFAKLRALPTGQTPTAEAHAFELPLADRSVRLQTLLQPLLATADR